MKQHKTKKLIAFDLDGTLAPTKSAMPDEMAEQISQLLDEYIVCVISGGKFEQFEKQFLANMSHDSDKFKNLHLLPTCGTRYYSYNKSSKQWDLNYSEDFKAEEKQKIIGALNKGFDDLGYGEDKVYGACVEDRESQITFSALGQDIVDELGTEGVEIKESWDPDNTKKKELRDYIAPLIPEFEVRVGGSTSIDVTKQGIDKAYGMKKIMDMLSVSKDEILFIGDRLTEGGNDYPVKIMGIDCLAIRTWQETLLIVKTLNLV